MSRYLFLMYHAEQEDGGIVLNERITRALAREHDVHLVTVGDHRPPAPDRTVISLAREGIRDELNEEYEGEGPFVFRMSERIKIHVRERGLEGLGLPVCANSFDAIVGYGDMTTDAALWPKEHHYQQATVGPFLTLDPQATPTAQGLQELGRTRPPRHGEV